MDAQQEAVIDSSVPVNPFVALRSNRDAAGDHMADVAERLKVKKLELAEAKAKLEAAWKESNAKLIAEEADVSRQWRALDADLRNAVTAHWCELAKNDPDIRTIDAALGLSVQVKKVVVITDEQKAVEWAEKNFPLAVLKTVDRELIDGFMLKSKPADRPGFVEVQANVTAVIKKL